MKRESSVSQLSLTKRSKISSTATKSEQSNTLFSYFKPLAATRCTVNSIVNYFKSTTTPPTTAIKEEIKYEDLTQDINEQIDYTKQEIIPDESSKDNVNDHTYKSKQQIVQKDTKLAWSTIFSKKQEDIKSESKAPIKQEIEKEEEERINSKGESKSFRKCPFYKYITGTQITVDAFNYGLLKNCTAYFLSHFHYDHYIGLTKHFTGNIYCSQITANLVIKKIRVDKKYIRALPMNEFLKVDNDVRVCLLDANHCPGSVMFLFHLTKSNKYILHTGDCRADSSVLADPLLNRTQIDTVYLDTTYCDSYYTFTPQRKIIEMGIDLVKQELKKYPQTLIVCGSYTIGKERIYTGIAYELDIKIHVSRDKFNILECIEDKKLSKHLTLNPNETRLHVLPMHSLNLKDLCEHLDKYPQYTRILAIKPTGWTHNSDSDLTCQLKNTRAFVYGLAYSEHTSFNELKCFIQHIKPKRIIPTVNVASKEKRDKMNAYFDEWLQVTKK